MVRCGYTARVMNAQQDATANGFSLGVLIIGSLLWEVHRQRDGWREGRLDMGRRHRVRVPIRYGRFSERRHAYTMVFWPDLAEDRFGHAIAIQCRSYDIAKEAKCLWAAESKTAVEGGVSASWGCVGLLPNPDSTRLSSEQLQSWRDFVQECPERESNYRALAAAGAGIDEEGTLKIPWPMLDAGPPLPFDAVLATATKPTIHRSNCPSPQYIAAAWKTTKGKRELQYFKKNREHGITTFQDGEIDNHLADSDHRRSV